MLFNLLDLVIKSNQYDIEVLLVRSGPLESKYRQLSNVQVLKPVNYGNEKNLHSRALNFLRYQKKLKSLKFNSGEYDIIFSNTIANGRILDSVYKGKKIITYVHELESVIKYFERNGDSQFSFELSTSFCVPSSAVMHNLVKNHGINLNKISHLHYFFPLRNVCHFDNGNEVEIFKKKYDIPQDSFMVLGMGVATFRKGFDLFMEISGKFNISDKISFVWIGDFVDDEMRSKYKASGSKVVVTGYLPNKLENFIPFDLFLLIPVRILIH